MYGACNVFLFLFFFLYNYSRIVAAVFCAHCLSACRRLFKKIVCAVLFIFYSARCYSHWMHDAYMHTHISLEYYQKINKNECTRIHTARKVCIVSDNSRVSHLKQLIFSRFLYHILDFDSANAISTIVNITYTHTLEENKKEHLPFQAKPFALTIKYPCRNCTFALICEPCAKHTHILTV